MRARQENGGSFAALARPKSAMEKRAPLIVVLAATVLAACGGGASPRADHSAGAAATSTGDEARVVRTTTAEATTEQEAPEAVAETPAPVPTDSDGERRLEERPPVVSSTVPYPTYEPSTDATTTLSVESTGSSGEYRSEVILPAPNLTTPPAREPAPLALIGYAFVPDRATRVLLATLELPPGRRFVPPISSCQDVLVYLVEGTLDASGTGIGSVDAPATLYAGDAVRFGPEGDGLVVNTSGESVRTVVAIARQEDAGPARLAPEERSDRLVCTSQRGSDPLVAPARVASFDTTAPLHATTSDLEVRILLDADAAGAEHAGLAVLVGTTATRVGEHVHDGAAEVLYIEDGAGVMRVGERTIDIHPGMSVYVPPGEPHSFEPTGDRPLRAVQFYAPSGPEQRFRGVAP